VSDETRGEPARPMADLIAVAVTLLFFALALWFVRFCDKV
jgi:hypothetical protein